MNVWFVVPVHGREDLTRVCLRQLRRTCDQLAGRIDATAVVIGDGDTLNLASDLGFATVKRNNNLLGRKFNDGFQLAADPEHNPNPADYVIPFGSDDWIDGEIIEPQPNKIVCYKRLAVVNETRTRIATLSVSYAGGCGIRVIPTTMLKRFGYRPAVEDANLGIDTGLLRRVGREYGGRMQVLCDYADVHDFQIIDWKTAGRQLHSYRELARFARQGREFDDPLGLLEAAFPDAVEEMRLL